jgi:hypothetical protein
MLKNRSDPKRKKWIVQDNTLDSAEVKFALEQAMKIQWGSRGIALLFP